MTTPLSAGWYPAPDGNGEQWWNGAGWSDGRRNGAGTVPGLPGYQAAPPVTSPPAPLGAPNPYAQPTPTTPATTSAGRVTSNRALVALIFGLLSIIVFAPLGIVGIVLGIMGRRKPGGTSSTRWMSTGAILLGSIGLVIGIVGLVISILSFAAIDFTGS
jgi:hypothetical protein